MVRVKLRHFYLVHSVEGPAWPSLEPGGFGPDPWYAGLTSEEIIRRFHDDAAWLWAQWGVELCVHSIQPLFLDSDFLAYAGKRSRESLVGGGKWSLGQPFINVFWVRDLTGPSGPLFGWAAHSGYIGSGASYIGLGVSSSNDTATWYDGCALVLSSAVELSGAKINVSPQEWMGAVLAHELGHLLGLCHVFYEIAGFHSWTLLPFDNDLPLEDSYQGDRNLMDYGHHPWRERTIESGELCLGDLLTTKSQRKRALATLFRRTSQFAISQETDQMRFEGEPSVCSEKRQFYSDLGYLRRCVLPDFLAELHAAWIG